MSQARAIRPIAPVCIIAATLVWATPPRAQTPAEFYRGKTINLDVGSSVGGGYDIHGRLLARHIGKHIPGNPTVVPRNVEGAGGLRLANILYNSAPRDGTAMGIVFRSVPFDPLFGTKGTQFDATRFTWIGSTSNEVSICVAWHTSGVTSIEDLRTKDLVVGSTGHNADTSIFAKVINGVLGTRMRTVIGYPGGNEISLAMERGELGGRCAWSWSAVKATRLSWVEQKQVHVFVQLALSKHPDLPHVPLVLDLTKTPDERAIARLVFARQQIAWPFVAPPGVPKDRAEALRAAFNATMQDKAYLAEAEKAKLEIMPIAGEEIERLIIELYATPAPIVQKTIEMLR
jgi:tripartite-type tricarboxylate transporter receptor subunit TctC